MPIGQYTIEEVYVGDEVAFDNDHLDTDHYWLVTGKDEQANQVFIKTLPQALKQDTWTLKVNEIRVLAKVSPLRQINQ